MASNLLVRYFLLTLYCGIGTKQSKPLLPKPAKPLVAIIDMIIREYKPKDKEKCIEVFKSNCPKFFDKCELDMFINWLDHQFSKDPIYKSPTYTNSEKDAYYVVELPQEGVIGCGGFYVVKSQNEARLAWGMIHSDFHKHGYGTSLYNYRKGIIENDWLNHTITLGTS